MKLDVRKLYQSIEMKRKITKSSFREIAKEIGVDQSLFSRIAKGRAPNANALALILGWLDIFVKEVLG